METPLSTRRITGSQTLADLNKNNGNDSDLCTRKRNALLDITNDSPIAGIAMETPTSSIVKKRRRMSTRTPGSGESLLRGQVTILLQKVEEGGDILAESRPVSRPKGSIGIPEDDNGLSSAVPSLVVEQLVSQVETEKILIARSLLLDFSEKLENLTDAVEVTSMLTYKGDSEQSECNDKMTASDDDVSSIWSVSSG